jgi:hypothetical protein
MLTLTSGWWTRAIARSLICERDIAPSDAILIENFDPDYLLFERARMLRHDGLAERVLVPLPTNDSTQQPNAVAQSIAHTMAELSRIGTVEMVPIRLVEPISLNAAHDIRRFLEHEAIRSIIVVTPLFRSRRSALVYHTALDRAGVAVRCEPVARTRGTEDWTGTAHGIQDVFEQWAKLQYYRWYVLPVLSNRD